MTPTGKVVTETDGLPTFDLQYQYDDVSDPETVTVYDAAAEDRMTTWISAAVEDTVRLDCLD